MTREHIRAHNPSGSLVQDEPAYQSPADQDVVVVTSNDASKGRQRNPGRPAGTPSTQSPQAFYGDLTRRPKVRTILTELAKEEAGR